MPASVRSAYSEFDYRFVKPSGYNPLVRIIVGFFFLELCSRIGIVFKTQDSDTPWPLEDGTITCSMFT